MNWSALAALTLFLPLAATALLISSEGEAKSHPVTVMKVATTSKTSKAASQVLGVFVFIFFWLFAANNRSAGFSGKNIPAVC